MQSSSDTLQGSASAALASREERDDMAKRIQKQKEDTWQPMTDPGTTAEQTYIEQRIATHHQPTEVDLDEMKRWPYVKLVWLHSLWDKRPSTPLSNRWWDGIAYAILSTTVSEKQAEYNLPKKSWMEEEEAECN